jgi:hypothetical protein
MRAILLSYIDTEKPIATIIRNDAQCPANEFYALIDRYAELKAFYARARTIHAEIMVQNAEDVLDAVPLTVEYADGRGGPNQAGARMADTRVRHRQWLAEKLHPAYRNRQESINTNVNLNAEVQVPADADLSSIIQAMHGRRE